MSSSRILPERNSKRQYLRLAGHPTQIGGILERTMVGEDRDRRIVGFDKWSGIVQLTSARTTTYILLM